MTTVWIYVDTSKLVDDKNDLKIIASEDDQFPDFPDFSVPLYPCGQTALADAGLLCVLQSSNWLIGAFMRHIGVSNCEQYLSRCAAEALKQVNELKQLRELVRQAEARALYRPKELARSPVNPKPLDPPFRFQVRELARRRVPRPAAAGPSTARAPIAAAGVTAGSR